MPGRVCAEPADGKPRVCRSRLTAKIDCWMTSRDFWLVAERERMYCRF